MSESANVHGDYSLLSDATYQFDSACRHQEDSGMDVSDTARLGAKSRVAKLKSKQHMDIASKPARWRKWRNKVTRVE